MILPYDGGATKRAPQSGAPQPSVFRASRRSSSVRAHPFPARAGRANANCEAGRNGGMAKFIGRIKVNYERDKWEASSCRGAPRRVDARSRRGGGGPGAAPRARRAPPPAAPTPTLARRHRAPPNPRAGPWAGVPRPRSITSRISRFRVKPSW